MNKDKASRVIDFIRPTTLARIICEAEEDGQDSDMIDLLWESLRCSQGLTDACIMIAQEESLIRAELNGER